MKRKLSTLILFLGMISFVHAQTQSPLDITLRYLEQNKKELGLSSNDLADWVISDQYQSAHNGLTHIYMIQRHQGVKIYNAMITSNVTNQGKIAYLSNRFIGNAAQKVNATSSSLSSIDALRASANKIGLTLPNDLTIKEKHSNNHIVYEKNGVALEPIHTELVYQPMPDGSLRLAWDIYIAMLDGQHAWSMRTDALTGDLLEKKDWVIHCSFSYPEEENCGKKHSHVKKPASKSTARPQIHASNFGLQSSANSYTVFAPPLESPSHGPASQVTTTGDATASPNGWHTVNANNYTITRGNNVHAYQDRDGNNLSAGDEPDGGPTLDFNFTTFDQANEPNTYVDAATVNLFYWNNYIHDVLYHYGFDEVSGNFQADNDSLGGFGSDEVFAEAQDNADDATVRNNANFSSGFSDGANGRMQMYLWNQEGADVQVFFVDSPASIAGGYDAGTASFGQAIGATPVTGELVLSDDGVGVTTDACEPITNGSAISGKIAVIDRGDCQFGTKALNAENEGAIAVVICNNVAGGAPGMAPGNDGASVTIPLLSLSIDDCNAIKMVMASETVTITMVNNVDGPLDYDGDFDNGIITHEYGHGVSIRLTGGPSANCLTNDEQAGEGWSDFFALVLSHEAGDAGTDSRGIGTYVERAGVDGGGIRRFPYSTDMNINPQDYDDIRGTTAPHPLGEIMAVALWDLYWNMIDLYGYDPDIYTGTGGNNLALQLVIDGLKMQGCQPGMLDARDAIIAADSVNNGGANYCLIWETFARRGMGIDAMQNNPDDRNDGVPGFNSPEDCTEELKIRKVATPSVTTDEDITYELHVINDSGQNLTGVTVSDQVPTGTAYVAGSVNMGGTESGGTITWAIGDLADDEELMLSFKVNPAQSPFTSVNYTEGFENGLADWIITDGNASTYEWFLDAGNPNSGTMAMFANDPDVASDQQLETANSFIMTGTRPALIFNHYYDTEREYDGGLVEFLDETFVWNDLGAQMVRNGYPLPINNSLVPTGSSAFSGNTGGYIESVVDMTDYLGKEGVFRFRMISDANTAGLGWLVDDISMVDLYTIPGEDACVSSNELPNICAATPDIGTIVYESPSANESLDQASFELNTFPNPTKDKVNVEIIGAKQGPATLSLMAVDGRFIRDTKIDIPAGSFSLDVSDLSAGVYLLRLTTEAGNATTKLMIE